MKLARWACCSALVALWALWLAPPAWAATAAPAAQVLRAEDPTPPAETDPRWAAATIGHVEPGMAAWYQLRFEAPADAHLWALYLPYLYGGGEVWLNGARVAEVPRNTETLRVRWGRPMLLPLPAAQLRPGSNLLQLLAVSDEPGFGTVLAPLKIGPELSLQPAFDRRLFAVRTVPTVTVLTGTVVGLLVMLIWWYRRDERLYGLFGLAAFLWALRTTTFVFDTATPGEWQVWRLLYFSSTGGFVIVLALLTLAMAGWHRPGVNRALLAYWALGPLAYLLGGEDLAAQLWVAGLAPVGLAGVVVAFVVAWRERSASTVSIAIALALAVAAGIHDYLVATNSPLLQQSFPAWVAQRLFLLHHAANLLLGVMGVLLAMRFIAALTGLETANRTLEARVQAREREIAASYDRIAALQREQAATEERQRIMRDLHDGLGSQLFVSLSRAERGMLDAAGMAGTLRSAIDQMRVAIEALTSEEQDFLTAFGNFRFRWDARLREAGLNTDWQVDLDEDGAEGEAATLAPHNALQLLHIVQEALTNVLKHARAQTVSVRLAREAAGLRLTVADDGRRQTEATPVGGGRGLANMRTRAQRLGGKLEITARAEGTTVSLLMPAARATPVDRSG